MTLALAVVATGITQETMHRSVPLVAFTEIDVAVLAVASQSLLFDRRGWQAVFLASQGLIVALDVAIALRARVPSVVYHHVAYTLTYLQLVAISTGVLRSWLGPAQALPVDT